VQPLGEGIVSEPLFLGFIKAFLFKKIIDSIGYKITSATSVKTGVNTSAAKLINHSNLGAYGIEIQTKQHRC